MILQIIEQDNQGINQSNNVRFYTENENLLGVANGVWQVYPMTIWDNSYTYIGATKDVLNRDPILCRYDSITDTMVSVAVGTIDNFDPIFHQRPIPIVGVDDHVYVFMINGHGTQMKVWKSNTKDILDGFTLHHTTSRSDLGYLNIEQADNFRIKLGFRKTTGSPNYGHIVARATDLNYNGFEFIDTTDPNYVSTNHRHYMMMPKEYGDNNWYYFGIMSRNDSGNQYFAQGYYKTQDFVNFYSISEVFSKDVVSNGRITDVEVEANLNFFGSTASDTTKVQASNGFVLSDEIYGTYFNGVAWKFYKINSSGLVTEYTDNIGLDTDLTDVNRAINLTYNGKNIVYSYLQKIYTCDLDFSNQREVFEFIVPPSETLAVTTIFPLINADKVIGNYALPANVAGNQFAYYVLNDKFIR